MNVIGNPAQDAILANDRAERRAAQKASQAFLAALKVGGPNRFAWRNHTFGNQWDAGLSATARDQRAAALRLQAEKEDARSRAVNRDPCPRCGARGDYGCGCPPVRNWRLVAL